METTVLFLFILAFSLSGAVVRFDGHRVLRVVPRDTVEVKLVSTLQQDAEHRRVDIWKYSNGVGKSFDFRVSPDEYPSTIRLLRNLGLHFEVMIEDIQTASERQRDASSGNTLNAIDFDYGRYHDFDEVNQWIDDMAGEYADDVTIFTASKTYEGRDVRGIKISKGGNSTRPAIWYQGGIHAREWISPATVMYMTAQLMEQYSTNADVKNMLDSFTLYVVPVLNADGYVYTWAENRLWRKTRTEHGLCRGTDPNRNFGYQWGESSGSSSDPCSETFRGPSAFSEPVVRGVTDYMVQSGVTFKGFIDFHSYSEVWMSPWGYTNSNPSDFAEQDAASAAAVQALEAVHGTKYEHGTIANVLYVANGNSVDWAYGAMGIKFSATPELRDKGQHGFLLPADQIIPTGEETLQGLLAWAKYVQEH